MKYTVADLKADIKNLPDDEEIVVLIEEDPDSEDEELELEDGDLLDIQETGGYVMGLRVIRARPR